MEGPSTRVKAEGKRQSLELSLLPKSEFELESRLSVLLAAAVERAAAVVAAAALAQATT